MVSAVQIISYRISESIVNTPIKSDNCSQSDRYNPMTREQINSIQYKRESKIENSIKNDTLENGYIDFIQRENSGSRNYDTQD